MPPRRRSVAPEPLDIDRVRADLAAGKAVRVFIASSAQFPDGASGRIRGLGDPDVVGAEFVEVEVAVNGVKDVIPFAPADLAPPAHRGRPVAEPGPALPSQRVATPPPAPRPEAERGTRPTAAAPDVTVNGSAARVPPASTAAGTAASPGSGSPRSSPAAAPAVNGAAERPAAGATSGPSTALSGTAKAGGRRPARAITVTLTTSEAEPTTWRVEARIGAKVALRATPVSPARAWDLVQSLENEALSSAVGAVLEQHRQATAARAQALAAELAAVQAELAALPPA